MAIAGNFEAVVPHLIGRPSGVMRETIQGDES